MGCDAYAGGQGLSSLPSRPSSSGFIILPASSLHLFRCWRLSGRARINGNYAEVDIRGTMISGGR